jgi:insertion element IS1 protein InsB
MDELWSFVDTKGNKQWVWLAMDVTTREVIGCHIGDRSKDSAQALWDSLPSVYRQCAKIYTDHWEAYRAVLPSTRHESVGKDSGLTSYIERLNNTFRQRISRLVRKTLSFSKKLENHIAAIWNFIHDYNYQIRVNILRRLPLEFSPSFTIKALPQIQGLYPNCPATKVAATQTKPVLGGLSLPNWRVMTL